MIKMMIIMAMMMMMMIIIIIIIIILSVLRLSSTGVTIAFQESNTTKELKERR
jgi:hypothetical protein